MTIIENLNVALWVIIVFAAVFVFIVKKRRKKDVGRDEDLDFVRRRQASHISREPEDGDSLIDEFYSERTSPERKAEIADELESLGYDTRVYRKHVSGRRGKYDDDVLMGSEGNGYRGTEPWDMEDE